MWLVPELTPGNSQEIARLWNAQLKRKTWAYLSGDLLPLGPQFGRLEIHVVLMRIFGASSVLQAFHLIATAGAVFTAKVPMR